MAGVVGVVGGVVDGVDDVDDVDVEVVEDEIEEEVVGEGSFPALPPPLAGWVVAGQVLGVLRVGRYIGWKCLWRRDQGVSHMSCGNRPFLGRNMPQSRTQCADALFGELGYGYGRGCCYGCDRTWGLCLEWVRERPPSTVVAHDIVLVLRLRGVEGVAGRNGAKEEEEILAALREYVE